jgi:hypothetical protein
MVAIDMSGADYGFDVSARQAVRSEPVLSNDQVFPTDAQPLPESQPIVFTVLGVALGAVAVSLQGIVMSPASPIASGSMLHTAILIGLLAYYLGLGAAALRAMIAVGRAPNLMWFVAGSFLAVLIKEAAPYLS